MVIEGQVRINVRKHFRISCLVSNKPKKEKGTGNPFVQSNLSKVRFIPNNRHWKEGALWCFDIFQGNCYYSMCCLTIPLCAFHDLVVNFVMDYHTGQIYSDQAILATCSSFKFFMSSSRSACLIKLNVQSSGFHGLARYSCWLTKKLFCLTQYFKQRSFERNVCDQQQLSKFSWMYAKSNKWCFAKTLDWVIWLRSMGQMVSLNH